MKPHRLSDLLSDLYRRINPAYGPGRQKGEFVQALAAVGIRPEHDNRGEEMETMVLVSEQELSKLRAELQRFQSSTAAVVGWIPKLPNAGYIRCELLREREGIRSTFEPTDEEFKAFIAGFQCATRLSSIKPGEVVVSAEEWAEVRLFLAYMGLTEYPYDGSDGLLPGIPFDGDYDDWSLSLCKKLGITAEILPEYIRNSALRSQATTAEGEKP